MQKQSYLLDTGRDCVAAGLASACVAAGLAIGTGGCTGAPGIGMPAGGHTGFGIIPVDIIQHTSVVLH